MNPSAFERIFGFPEASPEAVRSGLRVEGDCLVSAANGTSRAFGRLEIPSLDELRGRMGDEAFFAFLQEYVVRFSQGIATGDGFFALVSEYSDADLGWTLEQYFQKRR